MVKQVAVVETFEQAVQDVYLEAQESHRKALSDYREGVRAMAEGAGKLPPDDADTLLAACRALGISPERLSQDAATMKLVSNVNEQIDGIHARNEAKKAPLPELREKAREAGERFAKVKGECDARIRAADLEMVAARRALEQVERLPEERSDELRTRLMKVRDRNPHLFGDVSPEVLRRIVNPEPRRAFG